MSLEITRFILGPLENNCYLITHKESKDCVIIDPSFNSELILKYIRENDSHLTAVWITHAHFDHYIGIEKIYQTFPSIQIALHPDDLPLWLSGGEAPQIGLDLNTEIVPNLIVKHGHFLSVGEHRFKVLHTPGHTPGHVSYYSEDTKSAFCGDVIFYHSIGRTDLSGGNYAILISSIRKQIFSLPPATSLYSGHGQETTVQEEMLNNPFLT